MTLQICASKQQYLQLCIMLGFVDQNENRVQPVGDDPFTPKVLPMSPVRTLIILELAIGFEPTTC